MISREYWERMAQSIRGLQWKRTRLTQGGLKLVPNRPGVYIICAKPPRVPVSFQKLGLYNPMYIGKTDNLSERIGTHLNRPDENIEELREHFSAELSLWYAVADARDIESIEDDMIFCFWPAANRKIKIMGRVSIKGYNSVLSGKAIVQKSISANYRQNKGGKQ